MESIATNIEQTLKIKNTSFEVELKELEISSILLQEPLKEAREDTEDGLTSSIELLGVVQPIIVIPMEGIDDKYILVDGFRRIYSLTRLSETKVNALILSFDDKRAAKDDAMILGRVLSNTRKLSNNGLWNAIQHIEEKGVTDYTALDALFNLPGGNVLKLKDIMEGEHEEPREDYLTKNKDIDYAKRKLDKLRREAKRSEGDEDAQKEKKEDSQVREELGIETELNEAMSEREYQFNTDAMIAHLECEQNVMLMKRVSRENADDTEVLAVILLPCEEQVELSAVKVDHEHDYLVVKEEVASEEDLAFYKEKGLLLNVDESVLTVDVVGNINLDDGDEEPEATVEGIVAGGMIEPTYIED